MLQPVVAFDEMKRSGNWLTTQEAAEQVGVTASRIVQLLLEGRIKGAQRFGKAWAIPAPVVVVAVKLGRPKRGGS